jgi:predicted metal-dependent phosphoesterase TrpH
VAVRPPRHRTVRWLLTKVDGWRQNHAVGFADLHIHTTASDGMMSPAMVLNYVAAQTRLDAIAIADHDTHDGWRRAREFKERPENDHLAGVDLIPAVEVSSKDGHIIALFVDRTVPKGLSATETVQAIHEAGGLALSPHPYAWLPNLKQFEGVGSQFQTTPFDGVETRNSTPTETFNNLRVTWANRRLPKPLAEYGGSDAHFLWAIGRTWTTYDGIGAAALRKALLERKTRAGGLVWGPLSLLQYYRDRARWRRFCEEHGVPLDDL